MWILEEVTFELKSSSRSQEGEESEGSSRQRVGDVGEALKRQDLGVSEGVKVLWLDSSEWSGKWPEVTGKEARRTNQEGYQAVGQIQARGRGGLVGVWWGCACDNAPGDE